MRRAVLALATVLALLAPATGAGASPSEPTPVVPYIVGGVVAGTDAWPAMVALVTETQGGLVQFCGGTLIRADLVVTAAHCTQDFLASPAALFILIGRTDLSASGGELISATSIIQHPNWNASTLQVDISLIRLSQRTTRAPAVFVNSTTEPSWASSPRGTVFGWGRTSAASPPEDGRLRQIDIDVLSDAQCIAGVFTYQAGADLCGGGVGFGTCFGDSGGPFVVPTAGGTQRLAGIVSRGPEDCGSGAGILTRVATYAEWIYQVSQSPNTTRSAGPDRYSTAATLATSFPPGSPVVYLVTGESFPDAVTAAAAAGALGGPVLLTQRNQLPAATVTALQQLQPLRLIVVGGTGAVSDSVLQAAATAAVVPAERISGSDRYATAAALSANAHPSGASTVYITVGTAFPDAVASGPVAGGAGGGPVLLTETGRLPEATRSELARLGSSRVVILGGTSAVGMGVQQAIAETLPGATIERLSGPDRYATAAALSAASFSPGVPVVYLATGRDFPDALASGPIAVGASAPVLLIDGDRIPPSVAAEIRRLAPQQLVILGGRAAVPADTAWRLDGLL